MNDDLFGDDEPNTPATEPAQEPAGPATPGPADYEQRIAQLEGSIQSTAEVIKNTNDLVNGLARTIQAGMNAGAQRQPEPEPEPIPREQILNNLAADPEGFIRKVASQVFEGQASGVLAPTLHQVIDATHQAIMDGHANNLDSQFGQGTWNEVIGPSIREDIAALRAANPRALADRATMQALVDRQRGIHFDSLVERRDKHVKSMADSKQRGIQEIVSALPPGSIPRLRSSGGENELPPDADGFLQSVERGTGEPVDRKEFARLYNSGNTLTDYLKAVQPKGRA